VFRSHVRGHGWRPLLLSAALVPAALGLAACSDDEDGPTTLTITASDFAYEVAGDLTPGSTEIRLKNDGAEEHHVQLLRIDGDHSVEEAIAAVEGPPVDWLLPVGGVGGVAPGGEAAVFQSLDAGRYGLVCFIASPDGTPHFVQGMIGEFTIAESDEVNEAALPEAEVSVVGTDDGKATSYGFEAPETIEAGEVILGFTNQGAELHEAVLMRLAEGSSVEDLIGLLSGEAPPAPEAMPVGVGGVQGILPGASQVAKLDLEAGNYVLLCGIPNPSGVPHAALGMLRPLVVE